MFVFPAGSLKIKHLRKHHTGHFDKKACYGKFGETGTWKAVGGTGAYANASGGGTYKLSAQIIDCKKPKVSVLQIDAVGNLGL